MKKELLKKIEDYCGNSQYPYKVYFSRKAPDVRYLKYKYFFKYYNTHNVAYAFKNQKEIEDFLKNI